MVDNVVDGMDYMDCGKGWRFFYQRRWSGKIGGLFTNNREERQNE